MKTLYLHIGTPKTATSSIQKYLDINRAALEQRGCCFPSSLHRYPYINPRRNAHFMTITLQREDGSRDREQELRILREGMEQVNGLFQQFDNVILSDESLWRALAHSRSDVMPFLKKEAQNRGYQIKIIVYLRRQDDLIVSLWNQRIKRNAPNSNAGSTTSPEKRLSQVLKWESYMVDYASRLDSLAEFFGKENLIVRRFSRDSWVNGRIEDDFLHCIGIEDASAFEALETPANTSLQGNTIEIKRIINKDASFTPEDSTYLGNFLRDLAPESGQLYPCSMLSREEVQELLRKFEPGNTHVSDTYIGDGTPLFSDRLPELPKWQADNPYMMEDVIRFFSAVTVDLHRENESLSREVRELRSQVNTLRSFREKVKHPVRTLWNRLFHRNR